tara:strand:+ start:615 stop:1181 length:567 start_codon:yes stop_codon:yes gene_type:complete
MPDIEKDPLALFAGHPKPDEDACPRGCGALVLTEVKEEISLGGGAVAAARVPVLVCNECDFKLLAEGAESIRDAAVRMHKGLLRPDEIKEIRENLDFSRREFAEAFGVPASSMERWENGKLLQNKSSDTLLRMLRNRGNACAVDRRQLNRGPIIPGDTVTLFATVARSEEGVAGAIERSRAFDLRRAM